MMESLFDLLVRSAVIMAPVAALTFWQKLSAAERHTLAFAALLGAVLIAVLPVMTEWRIRVAEPAPAVVSAMQSQAVRNEAGGADTPASVERRSKSASEEVMRVTPVMPQPSVNGWLSELSLIYLGVVLVLILQAAVSWWRVTRRIRLLPLVREFRTGLDRSARGIVLPAHVDVIPAHVRILEENCASPWTWGVSRQVLVLPSSFADWSPQRRAEALQHELAHIERRDHLTQILGHLLAILFWFQPLAWVLRARLRRLAEQASDDCVLEYGSPADQYAQTLLDVARHGDAPLSGFAMSGHPLAARVDAILKPQIRRTPMRTSGFLAVAVLMIGLAVPIAAVTTQPPLPDDSPIMPLFKVAPVYPRDAQTQRIEGYVVLEFEVTEQGKTRNVTLLEESVPGVFTRSAIAAASQFLYLPARENGENVSVSGIRNRITYALGEDGGKSQISSDWVTAREALEESLASSDNLDPVLLSQALRAIQLERGQHQQMLGAVIEKAELQAARTGNGDAFVHAAGLATSLNEDGHAIYSLMRASEFELTEPEQVKLKLAQLLLELGQIDDAKALFAVDAETNQVSEQWLTYLEREQQRRKAVYGTLSSRFRPAPASTEKNTAVD